MRIGSKNKIQTIGLLGFDGGKLKNMVAHSVHVVSDIGEYQLVEDCHSIICHVIAICLGNANQQGMSRSFRVDVDK